MISPVTRLRYQNRGSYYDRIIPGADLEALPPPPYQDAFPVKLPDGDWALLPFLALPPDFTTAIAYLCITENSFALEDRLSTAMAALARPLRTDVVVGMPTLGMVLAASVARKLGHEHYVPLSYSRKFWFEDELSIPVNSITTPVQPKTVYIDPRLIERLEGNRVLLVEDVISTGGTVAAELALMKKLGAQVVGVVTAIRETRVWHDKLAAIDPAYPALVTSPIRCPLFPGRGSARLAGRAVSIVDAVASLLLIAAATLAFRALTLYYGHAIDLYQRWLGYILIWTGPWISIVVIDYFKRGGRYSARDLMQWGGGR